MQKNNIKVIGLDEFGEKTLEINSMLALDKVEYFLYKREKKGKISIKKEKINNLYFEDINELNIDSAAVVITVGTMEEENFLKIKELQNIIKEKDTLHIGMFKLPYKNDDEVKKNSKNIKKISKEFNCFIPILSEKLKVNAEKTIRKESLKYLEENYISFYLEKLFKFFDGKSVFKIEEEDLNSVLKNRGTAYMSVFEEEDLEEGFKRVFFNPYNVLSFNEINNILLNISFKEDTLAYEMDNIMKIIGDILQDKPIVVYTITLDSTLENKFAITAIGTI